MADDPFNLQRFEEAQTALYAIALRELGRGQKQSHWMWFIFPQLAALGRSHTARFYGLSGLAEAKAYLAHPLLGPRLLVCVRELLRHAPTAPGVLLGEVDALKLRSCLTLFHAADAAEPLWGEALQAFYAGREDPLTLSLLAHSGSE
jgi:uncharacterized protein (DUF1810 family)